MLAFIIGFDVTEDGFSGLPSRSVCLDSSFFRRITSTLFTSSCSWVGLVVSAVRSLMMQERDSAVAPEQPRSVSVTLSEAPLRIEDLIPYGKPTICRDIDWNLQSSTLAKALSEYGDL